MALGPIGTEEEEQAKQAALKAADGVPMEKNGGANGPMEANYSSSDLFLEITGVTSDVAHLIVHNTQPDVSYEILSKLALTDTNWSGEQNIIGAVDQDWTPTDIPTLGRTNLFLWAISLGDTDGDGMPDFWELEHQFNPNDPSDAGADPDGDGYTNQEEYLLGQDPHVADPPRPTITVAATDANAGEPNDPGVFTLTRTGSTSRSLSVYYTVKGIARAGSDYQALSGEVVFDVNQSMTTIQIQPVDDAIYEGPEELTLQLLPGLFYINDTNDSATVTISDNEVQPIKVWAWPEEITEEGSQTGAFKFSRRGDVSSPLTLYFTLSGTASNGVDYQTLPASITFAAEAAETNLNVVPINNTNYSGLRTVQLTVLTNAAYLSETNVGVTVMTIADDERPTVQVVADDSDAREGTPVRDGRFKFIRNASVNEPLDVTFAVHGTAVAGSDYDQLPETLTIPAGTNAAILTVHPVDDGESETRETVIVVLRGSFDYKIGVTNSATVFIDDNEPVAYEWELLSASAVAETSLSLSAQLVIRRNGSTLTNASFPITLRDTNGTLVYQEGINITGDVTNNSSPFLPVGQLQHYVVFTNRNAEARVKLNRPTGAFFPASFYPTLRVYVTNLFATAYQTMYFHRDDRLIRVDFLTNQVTEGGAPATLRFSRRGPQIFEPLYPDFNLAFQVDGLAQPGADHTLTNFTINFPGNARTVDVPVRALTDTLTEGWESLYARLNPLDTSYAPDTRAGSNWVAALNIRDPGVTGPATPLDNDGDGMSDDFERAYGNNPFVFNDPYQDSDGDGMPDLEESLAGTNPHLADSDNDGLDDYTEWTHGSDATNAAQNTLSPASDYASVKLAVASCFKCHQSTLQAGQYKLTSVPPIRGHTVDDTRREQIFQFLRGQSYPIHVGGPVTADINAFYTAEILAATNTQPEFFLDDPDGMLGVGRPVSNLVSKVATLIVPKVGLTWTNKGDNLPLDGHTNSTGQVMGKRTFVGAKTPSENNARNTVMLKVTTTPPLVGSNVWFKAFDVDDTTDETFDNERKIDTNGRSGDDNFADYLGTPLAGLFVTNSLSTYSTTLDSNGEALVEFRVGMQPGNNYRVAATVFPSSTLGSLQSGNAAGNYFVSAYTDTIRGGFNGALSPLLTVWRRLHLEIDSMNAPPTNGPEANFKTSTLWFIKTNTPNAGQTTVYLPLTVSPSAQNTLENGTLQISGLTNLFTIMANYPRLISPKVYAQQDVLIVDGAVPLTVTNSTCILRDDDGQYVAQLGLPSALPMNARSAEIIQGCRPPFFHACILLSDANQLEIGGTVGTVDWNTSEEIGFKRNEPAVHVGYLSWFNTEKEVADSASFWGHTVVYGFQPQESNDCDPDSENAVLGGTVKSPLGHSQGYSVVWTETTLDSNWQRYAKGEIAFPGRYENVRRNYWYALYGTTVHEIGHSPGNQFESTDHNEGEVMSTGGPSIDAFIPVTGPVLFTKPFSPITVKRFRSAKSWTD